MTWHGPVFVYTEPSDVRCIRHQEGIITHRELSRYANYKQRYVKLNSYTCICTTVKSYDMTWSSVCIGLNRVICGVYGISWGL
jgi:hypothetical protein